MRFAGQHNLPGYNSVSSGIATMLFVYQLKPQTPTNACDFDKKTYISCLRRRRHYNFDMFSVYRGVVYVY